MSELKEVALPPDKSGIHLGLYRHDDAQAARPTQARKPVLLLHGASASHLTFTVPNGGLAKWLAVQGFDPWLLDWRGSGRVVENPKNQESLAKNGTAYNFNRAAQEDVPRVVRFIKEKTSCQTVAAVGFCMGSAILAEAVALGHVTDADVDCLVLMTLGLFYETAIDGRLKSEDRVLERIAREAHGATRCTFVDPRVAESGATLKTPWPARLDRMYARWPGALKSHVEQRNGAPPLDLVTHMCNRLSFMYGMPYHHGNLVHEIHAAVSGAPELPLMFGGIPLHMFIHGARNIRRGQATYYPEDLSGTHHGDEDFVSDSALERFRSLTKVTLITGSLNRLWHRDSIDLMYEWLTRGSCQHLRRFRKRVIPKYGHQDLLWGKDSTRDVYREIEEGLSDRPSTS